MSSPPAQPNQSLIDGLQVLQALAVSNVPVGSRQMARQLDLEPTRVNRLLKTLAHLGIAQQTSDKRYLCGPGMHVLATQAMFGSGLLRRSIEPLESLRRFKLSVAMGVLWRDHVSYLYHAAPDMRASEALGRVAMFPATRSGIGMVLMSRLTPQTVKTLFARQNIPNFPTFKDLTTELNRIRQHGYAVVRPFAEQSTRTIAVAIKNEPAAVALSGDFSDSHLPELVQALRSTCDRIIHD